LSLSITMEAIGSIVASDLSISRRITTWSEYPNVAAIHPTVSGEGVDSADRNVICLVDLAQQRFEVGNAAQLESLWWLSFKNWWSATSSILRERLSAASKDEDIESVILQFVAGDRVKLCGEHHVAELFIESFYETDSLIAFRTPSSSPKPTFDFLSFSAENPYALSAAPTVSVSASAASEDTLSDDEAAGPRLELLRVDAAGHCLWRWFEIAMPKLTAPRTTSREKEGAALSSMMEHWECRLSEDRRYLLIFPQKLGEIGDVELRHNALFWVHSLCTLKGNGSRSVFAVNRCDLRQQFECQCLGLVVARELPARFRILPYSSRSMLIWNFSANGAVDDLFAVIGPDHEVPAQLRNRMLGVENAQNFKNYRFKDGALKDLIRDVPKLCALNGRIVFGGACFVSVLDDVEAVTVFEDTAKGDGPKLITKTVAAAFYHSSWLPVHVLPPQDMARWIADYVPFRAQSVLARWPGDHCKARYGVWRFVAEKAQWQCVESMDYDEMAWNSTVMGCYHFGERTKTLLLAIDLTNK